MFLTKANNKKKFDPNKMTAYGQLVIGPPGILNIKLFSFHIHFLLKK